MLCRSQLRLLIRRVWMTIIYVKCTARCRYSNCLTIPTSSSFIRSHSLSVHREVLSVCTAMITTVALRDSVAKCDSCIMRRDSVRPAVKITRSFYVKIWRTFASHQSCLNFDLYCCQRTYFAEPVVNWYDGAVNEWTVDRFLRNPLGRLLRKTQSLSAVGFQK